MFPKLPKTLEKCKREHAVHCCFILFTTETEKARIFLGVAGRTTKTSILCSSETSNFRKYFLKKKLPNEFTTPILFPLFPEKEITAQK